MATLNRIGIDPKILCGKPTVRGTRIAAELVLRKLSEGATQADLLDAYPSLTVEDIHAVLAFAADAIAEKKLAGELPRG